MKHLCQGILDDVIESPNGTEMIFDAIDKEDPLSVVSTVYQELETLFSNQRYKKVSYRNLQSLFSARISNFNALCTSIYCFESMAALFMLRNENFYKDQGI